MRKAKFPIDPTQLDKSAAAAFQAHVEKRLSYADWKATAATIERLHGIEAFRRQHGDALRSAQHLEHTQRTEELTAMFEQAYPNEPGAA
jgi:hypothetical protein